MTHNIRINTEGFRAINKADIIIDGITLVAGENGCGKSTLSKLLYFLYKTVSNYDVLIKKELRVSLDEILKVLEILYQDIFIALRDRNIREDFRKETLELRRGLYKSKFLDDELHKWKELVEKTEYLYLKYSQKENNLPLRDTDSRSIYRIKQILQDVLKEDVTNDDIKGLFIKIQKEIEGKFKEAFGKIESRPISLFTQELKKVFSDEKLPKVFEVFEFEDVIVSLKKSNLSIPFSIQSTIYIDTPMMIGVENNHNLYWEDLNNMLLDNNNGGAFTNEISSLISSNIIKGDASITDDIFYVDEFKFTREDGAIFSLLDVATGIKSFSILQLLLKNGKLNDKTLLIIDEPESNLHPQWIVEYAKVIVLLNKKLGVKIFLASHNPDMVSAIRYISEKEGILSNVNFYLAEKSERNYLYNYKYLDKEIDPIFDSFNIAIDRINQYGI